MFVRHLVLATWDVHQLWEAERIRGELLKLGIQASTRTIQKYVK